MPTQTNKNLLAALEANRTRLIVALAICCSIILCITAMRIHGDYDVWWHLRMGMDWMENGLSPWVDHYSYTYAGAEISGPPVLFQAGIWLLTKWFGELGGQFVYKVIMFLGVLALMLAWFRTIQARALAAIVILPLLVAALQIRVMVRPELVSYLLAVIALILYHRTQLRLEWRSMVPVILLLVFWTLYHSPIFGFVIFAGLFVDIGARLLRDKANFKEWLQWAGWGALAFAAGFAKGIDSHTLITSFFFVSDTPWATYIAEYTSTLDGLSRVSLMGKLIPFLLFAITVLAAILSLKQRRPGYVLVLLTFTLSALSMNRMVAPAAVVNLAIFAHVFSRSTIFENIDGPARLSQKSSVFATLPVAAIVLFSDIGHARFYLAENRTSWARLPTAMVDYMDATGSSGNVFSDFQLGGFFLYKLAPKLKVHIDGRTGILYPFDHAMRHQAALRSSEIFAEENKKYGIDFVVLRPIQRDMSMMAESGFELDFVDASYALFRKSGGQLRALGNLWAEPNCWQPELVSALLSESSLIESNLPPYSAARSLSTVTKGYIEADNKGEFLSGYNLAMLTNASSTRFHAYRSLDAELYSLALTQFKRLPNKTTRDQLAMAFAELMSGNERNAALVATGAASESLSTNELSLPDAILLLAILERSTKVESQDAVLTQLFAQVGNQSLKIRNRSLDASSFCSPL